MPSENRSYYSIYCHEIFNSSNHRNYPKAIAYRDEEDSVALSESFLDVIEQSGFKVNDSKVSLKGKDNRQVVTGIVVNEKKNVPREFVREVRAMIYGWEKAGDLKSFDKYWKENYANRNREDIEDVSFDQVLRGKLSFIKAVKGEADSTYLSLAKRVAALDPSFSIDPKAVRAHAVAEIIVIGEGKTDQLHMEAALNWFHARGKYSELNIKFKEINYKAGDQELLKEAEYLSRHVQKNLVLCVFDSDVSETVKKAKGSAKLYLDRGNNVFTLVIPSPAFRGESICIEHLYKDSDLKKKDSKGRRLYFVDEFDQKLGFHLKDFGIYRPRPGGKTLIVDSDVVDIRTHKNIALTKNDFASKVISKEPPFNDRIDRDSKYRKDVRFLKVHGLTDRSRFRKLVLEAYQRLVAWNDKYKEAYENLKEECKAVNTNLVKFEKDHDLLTIINFLKSMDTEEIVKKHFMGENFTPEEFYELEGIWAEFGKIVCISVGFFD